MINVLSVRFASCPHTRDDDVYKIWKLSGARFALGPHTVIGHSITGRFNPKTLSPNSTFAIFQGKRPRCFNFGVRIMFVQHKVLTVCRQLHPLLVEKSCLCCQCEKVVGALKGSKEFWKTFVF